MKTINEKISELEKQFREAKTEKDRIETENPTTIGGRIYRVMRIKGITHTEISKKVGICRQSVTHYLNDQRKCPADIIGKIAKALDVSCDYLILGETNGGEDIS